MWVPTARFLVVLDADSTLIENESIELLAAEAGSLRMVAEITDRTMRGDCDFSESLRERVSTLKGLTRDVFSRVAPRISVTRGVPQLVAAIHEAGGVVGVVSGGFHELLDPIAKRLGLDFCRANRLAAHDGRLTGLIDGLIIDAEAKAAALSEWATQSAIPLTCTIAVGDGANDLPMLRTAGLGIAFDAKPVVYQEADVCIITRDLSHVLPLIGLRSAHESP